MTEIIVTTKLNYKYLMNKTKSELAYWILSLIKDKQSIQEKVITGTKMSNVFFNWSQQDRFTEDERAMMKSLYSEWDKL